MLRVFDSNMISSYARTPFTWQHPLRSIKWIRRPQNPRCEHGLPVQITLGHSIHQENFPMCRFTPTSLNEGGWKMKLYRTSNNQESTTLCWVGFYYSCEATIVEASQRLFHSKWLVLQVSMLKFLSMANLKLPTADQEWTMRSNPICEKYQLSLVSYH